jgi:hypothetical protein
VAQYRDGNGAVRRGFLLADIEAFYRAIKRGGQSDDTTLSALVYELQRERGSPKTIQSVKRKRSRRRSLGSLLSALDGSR